MELLFMGRKTSSARGRAPVQRAACGGFASFFIFFFWDFFNNFSYT
jgi:hypothetical protein